MALVLRQLNPIHKKGHKVFLKSFFKDIGRPFHVLAQFLFTTSKTELESECTRCLRLRIGNRKFQKKFLKFLDLMVSTQLATQKGKF